MTDAKNEFSEKMKRGELAAQRLDFLKGNILRPANEKVLIIHCKTNQALAVLGDHTIMAVDVPGLVGVVVFYLIILVIGIWASRKSKKVEKACVGSKSEVAIVGGRNISVLVGVFTMTGGLFFAKPMRSKRYVTMLDPFQHRYGNMFTATLLLPALVSDILWVACILAALGGTMSIILGLSSALSIIISAAVSIVYTFLGGLYSVAYTDIIQLSFIFFSMWLCIPFLVLSPAVTENSQMTHVNQTQGSSWTGELQLADAGKWTDEMLLLALGGLAYQALYQRILSASSSAQAQVTCFAAAGTVFIMGIPSVVIGAVASSADWNLTAYGLPPPYERGEAGKILPLALRYLTPTWVSLICVLHFRYANTYGAISGYIAGLLLRGLSGEPLLGIPPVLLYPGWREDKGVITQYFPYRTLAM
ncbi:hypothetical protein INR49_007830, partial [Caranx melampygus]